MTATRPPAPPLARPPLRFGNDTQQACARISRWSRFLAIIGIISVVLSVVVGGGLWIASSEPVQIALALFVLVTAVITLFPTIRMFAMSRSFGRVAFPADIAALIDPLRSLRVVLVWFVAIGAVGQAFVLGAAIVNLATPGILGAFGLDKPGKTIRAMREVALAIDGYAREHHAYPVAKDYAGLREVLGRAAGEGALPATDAWGRPFHYDVDEQPLISGARYTLMTFGADGVRQDPERTRPEQKGEPKSLENVDVIIESGVFVEGPAEILGIVKEDE